MGLFQINTTPTVTVTSVVDGYKSAVKFSNFNNAPRIDYWGNYYDIGAQLFQQVSLSLNSGAADYTVATSISALYFQNTDKYNLDFYAPCLQVTNKTGKKLYQMFGTSVANQVVDKIISLGYTSVSAERIWCRKHTTRNILATSAGNRDLWNINGRWIPQFYVLRGGRYGAMVVGNGNTGTRSLDMTVSTVFPRVDKINTIIFELKASAKPSVVGYCYFYDSFDNNVVLDTPDVSLTSTSDLYLYGGSNLKYSATLQAYRKHFQHWFMQRLPNLNEMRSGNFNRLWNTAVSTKRQQFEVPSFQLRYGASINGGDQFYRYINTPGPLLRETSTGRVYHYQFISRLVAKALKESGVSVESWLSTQLSAVSVVNRMYRMRLAYLETSAGFLPTNTYVTAVNASTMYHNNYKQVSAFYSVVSAFNNPWTDDTFTPYTNLNGNQVYDRFAGTNYTDSPSFFKYANGKYVIGFKRLAKANWLRTFGFGPAVAGFSPTEKAVTTIAIASIGTVTKGTDFYPGVSANISYYRFFEIDAANLNNVSAINSAPVTVRHLRSAAPNIGTSADGWFTSVSGSRRWGGGDTSYVQYSQLYFDSTTNKIYVTDHLPASFSQITDLYTTSSGATSVVLDAVLGSVAVNFYNNIMKYNFSVSAAAVIVNRLRRIFTLSSD